MQKAPLGPWGLLAALAHPIRLQVGHHGVTTPGDILTR